MILATMKHGATGSIAKASRQEMEKATAKPASNDEKLKMHKANFSEIPCWYRSIEGQKAFGQHMQESSQVSEWMRFEISPTPVVLMKEEP